MGNDGRTYPLGVGVWHSLHESVQLIAHGFRGNTSSSTFEMLFGIVYIQRDGQIAS
jgi:hypothetical protein